MGQESLGVGSLELRKLEMRQSHWHHLFHRGKQDYELHKQHIGEPEGSC